MVASSQRIEILYIGCALTRKQIKPRRLDPNADRLPETLHPVLKRIYLARQVQSMDELDYSLARLLRPDDLCGIDDAVSILVDVLDQDRRILIVADFDADGATSCAVAMRGLRMLGANDVRYIVPDRVTHGYGLTPEIVEEAAAQEPYLIITVDNGISSIAGVELAKRKGIRVLITDHHLAGDQLPQADAIVNPNQPGDNFASKALAGVGVIFYVLLALRTRLRDNEWFAQRDIPDPNLAQLLDLVALGTVADLVPLDSNNRLLVAQGLARINAGHSVEGIKALLDLAGRNPGRLSTSDLGFFIAPRLNAAGRLEDMSLGIECLLTDSADVAYQLATELDRINRERRTIQQEMQDQALLAVADLDIEDEGLPKGLCLFNEDWHQGVVGLVASKVKEQHHRPVVAMAPAGNEEIKGSARSIPGLHIRDTLDAIATRHPSLLQKFGGHAMAAGLSIQAKDLDAFRRAFDQEVDRLLSDDDLDQQISTDGSLSSDELAIDFAEQLRAAGPWGQAFPEPVFEGVFRVVSSRVVGDKHVKMRVADSGGREIDAIAFNQAIDGDAPDWQTIRMAYRLDVNEFRGTRSAQLVVEYMEPDSLSGTDTHEKIATRETGSVHENA
jgi:single-stranded-DNA-specific exonuclease